MPKSTLLFFSWLGTVPKMTALSTFIMFPQNPGMLNFGTQWGCTKNIGIFPLRRNEIHTIFDMPVTNCAASHRLYHSLIQKHSTKLVSCASFFLHRWFISIVLAVVRCCKSLPLWFSHDYVVGLVQDGDISTVCVLEIPQFCTKLDLVYVTSYLHFFDWWGANSMFVFSFSFFLFVFFFFFLLNFIFQFSTPYHGEGPTS